MSKNYKNNKNNKNNKIKKKKKNSLIWLIAIIVIIGVVLVAMFLPNGNKIGGDNVLNINFNIAGNETKLNDYDTTNPVVAMYIENYGAVVIELYPNVAPNTVNNFISLVKKGFYDDNNIIRVQQDFVLQGGDPTGTGSGGPGYYIKGEFNENGFQNDLKHDRGVISMARSSSPDSAGSQFFIMLEKSEVLDGRYAAFGKVIAGMDVIDNIEANEKDVKNTMGFLNNSIKIVKTIIDLKGKSYPEVVKAG